mmetsp:Transcript_46508/g.97727  ORF Transcript_46508/g.97727 Transcript_46508/m.97727 type:complete len:346 (-) Transcript_46508:88-1125(-)|eukprot:CAMPEP_0183717130 /NCGR_PEP_ID=MMETSP0737-20130205/10831_1 /TAXON_ID=385413 /ORGANISM="Thalassiosira miniscula, Strain CCMP1093" /LENGTH=345 /DNA_ID=CAMNT_0025946513 /DNA_START=1 /DNA_END=1038 /DNA_ORIENTATION=-
MSPITGDQQFTFAPQLSLRKSFSAIHRRTGDASPPCLSPVNTRGSDNGCDDNDHVLTRDRPHRFPSPTSSAAIPCVELAPLPFTKQGNSPQESSSNDFFSSKKFQRRNFYVKSKSKPIELQHDEKAHSSHDSKRSRRRTSVTFITPTPQPPPSSEKKQTDENKGFRRDYSLGDTVRSQSHMIIEPSYDKTIQAVDSLCKHDFAFVKRSDGSYSYSILAYRCDEPIKGTNHSEECMVFVMNDIGATKMIRKRYWHKLIRLVSMKDLDSLPKKRRDDGKAAESSEEMIQNRKLYLPDLCREIEKEGERWTPPAMIEFASTSLDDEEYSLISSVSDRARALSRRRVAT